MASTSKKKLYLVDASSVFFRAYYAIPFMQVVRPKKQRLHTNATYGYLTTTLKILDRFQPQYIVYCFDRKEPSIRVKYYPEYKANREAMPDDLEEQIPYIHQVTDLLGIPRMDKKGYEADDLIGSLTHWAQSKKMEVVIVSSDKDFAQLVNKSVTLYDPMKDINYNIDKVKEKWGVTPSQIVDYLAVVGDASDNIPGVRGIGAKGAQKLFSTYTTLEEIYKNLKELTPRMTNQLKDSKKEAFLSQKLARIITNLSLTSNLKDIEKSPMDQEKMKSLLVDLEFRSTYKKIFPENKTQVEEKKPLPKQKLHQWTIKQLEENLRPYEEVGVFMLEDQIYCLIKNAQVKILKASLKEFGSVLSHKKIRWWGYDLKSMWKACDVYQPIGSWDLMIASHLCDNKPSRGLSSLSQFVMGVEDLQENNTASILLQMRKIYQKKLEDMDLIKEFETIEMPIVSVLYRMEKEGILLDKKQLLAQRKTLDNELIDLENDIFEIVGHPFNVASPQQLAHVLFEEMGLAKTKKTKTGHSTDSEVLKKLAPLHPIAQKVLIYRELFKLKTTYVEGLLEAMDEKSHRVHTSFNQTLTSTGRLSSVKPNLQNIPIRTERGRKIREYFIAPKGHRLIVADYSQIELRILAHFSKDPALKKAFLNDEDIHCSTARELFDVPIDKVTEEQRRVAKTVNFGITYGQTAFGLSETLGVSPQRAKEIVDQYFKKFSKVQEYMDKVVKTAKKKGYVETLFGRRRIIPELFSKNVRMQKFGERAAINATIQGTASDLVKKAMIQLDASVRSKILLQIHDELIFECAKEDISHEMNDIRSAMENQETALAVPLKVHIGEGLSWHEASSK